jgi:hypothetical protein
MALIGTINSPNDFAFKNRIMNGAFAISQRGTSFTPTDSAYGLDRWHFRLDGTPGTLAVTQAALAAAELPPFSYAMRFNQSVTASGRTYLRVGQYIEGLEAFSGQQVVVSFYAKCASGTVAIPTLRLDRYFGTGGSPSSADNMSFSSGGSPTITTTWTRYTAIGTVNSTSGKTYGTNNNSSLLVGIDFPTSGTFDVYVTGFQVEIGSVATPFEFRPIGTELALCQRYYSKSYNHDVVPGTATQVGMEVCGFQGASGLGGAYGNVKFPVKMRTTPGTINIWDGAGTSSSHSYTYGGAGSAQAISNGGSWWGSGTPFNTSHSGFFMRPTGSQASAWNYVHYTADAEL